MQISEAQGKFDDFMRGWDIGVSGGSLSDDQAQPPPTYMDMYTSGFNLGAEAHVKAMRRISSYLTFRCHGFSLSQSEVMTR